MRLKEFNIIDKLIDMGNKLPTPGKDTDKTVPVQAVAPVHELLITQNFAQGHNGVDLRTSETTPLYAPESGIITTGFEAKGAGIFITLKSATGLHKMFHLSKVLVHDRQRVQQGQQIGICGNTGRSTAPHLHWEYWVNGRPVDPLSILR